ARYRLFVDFVRAELALFHPFGDAANRAHDLRPCPIADHQVQPHRPPAPGRPLDLVNGRPRSRREPVEIPEYPNLHAPPPQLVTLPRNVALEQRHERGDLARRPVPVLLRERIQRQDLDPHLHAPLHRLPHGPHPGRVAPAARQSPRPGPTSVPVHDDGNVMRNAAVQLDRVQEIRWHERQDVSLFDRCKERAGPRRPAGVPCELRTTRPLSGRVRHTSMTSFSFAFKSSSILAMYSSVSVCTCWSSRCASSSLISCAC